jgi:hypothetical protein
MKKYRVAGPGLAVALSCLALPDSAEADLRFRTDGNLCRPWNQNTKHYADGDSHGFNIQESDSDSLADAATCAIPLGAAFLELGASSAYVLDQINVRLSQHGSANVATHLIAHDYTSPSMCTCGNTNGPMNSGDDSLRTMPFDCGSCSYETNWAVALHVNRNGTGTTTIRLISAYDDN